MAKTLETKNRKPQTREAKQSNTSKRKGTTKPQEDRVKNASRSGTFTIENVRCFAGSQSLTIAPLTFLVGENSTGKSTILGAMRAFLGRSMFHPIDIDFNIPPYQMGSFSDIVRKNASSSEDNFRLGIQYESSGKEKGFIEYIAKFTERPKASEPILQEFRIRLENGSITFKPGKEFELSLLSSRPSAGANAEAGSNNFSITMPDMSLLPLFPHVPFVESFFGGLLFKANTIFSEGNSQRSLSKTEKSVLERFKNFINANLKGENKLSLPFPPLYSFAPVRSRPRRTYDPVREVDDPEGSTIPILLKNLYTTKKTKWEELRKKLIQFGRASGLFSDIDIKNFGKSNEPFQLRVKVRGPKVNIADVGYGVSQILPIIVEILRRNRKTTFLLQQPEVHLHPKAQAELSSLLVQLSKDPGHNFIIETHSDYMVNRASIEVRNGKLFSSDLSLIYMELKDDKSVRSHNISFNENGEIQNPPKGYRDFFLKESDRFLGFSK